MEQIAAPATILIIIIMEMIIILFQLQCLKHNTAKISSAVSNSYHNDISMIKVSSVYHSKISSTVSMVLHSDIRSAAVVEKRHSDIPSAVPNVPWSDISIIEVSVVNHNGIPSAASMADSHCIISQNLRTRSILISTMALSLTLKK